eukprot:756413-Hanusia_phi.AAC.2
MALASTSPGPASDGRVLLEQADHVIHALVAFVKHGVDRHCQRLCLPARPQLLAVDVARGCQQVSLPPRLVELQHRRRRPRADRPRAEDADDAGRVLRKLLPPDVPDLPAPQCVVPPASLVLVRAQPQRQPPLLAVGAGLVPAGPHLVAVLNVDLDVLTQRLPHQPRHLPHVVVAGGVGDTEPGGGAKDVGDADHVLERHACVLAFVDVGLRRKVRPRPVLPLHNRRVVGRLPVHEAEDAEGSDVSQEEGDADVADGVGRVAAIDPQEHAVVPAVGLERLRARPVDGGLEQDFHSVLGPLHHLGVEPESDLPPPLVLHREDPAGRVLEDVSHQQLAQHLPRPEPRGPSFAVQEHRLPSIPRARAHVRRPQRHPLTTLLHRIHENPLGAPVSRSSQVQPDTRPPVALVPQDLARLPLSSCPAQAAAMVATSVLACPRTAALTGPDAPDALRTVAVPLASSGSCPPAIVADAGGPVSIAPSVPVALAVDLAVVARVSGVAAADLQVDRLPVAVASAVEEAARRSEEALLALAPEVTCDLVFGSQQLAAPLVERALVPAVHHVHVTYLAAVAPLVPVVACAGAGRQALAMSRAVVRAAAVAPNTAVVVRLHVLQDTLVLVRCVLVLVRRLQQPPAAVLARPPDGAEVHFDPLHADVQHGLVVHLVHRLHPPVSVRLDPQRGDAPVLDEKFLHLVDGLGDRLPEHNVEGERSVLRVVAPKVGRHPYDVNVLVCAMAGQELVRHDRPDPLGGGDDDDAVGFCPEHLLPYPCDLSCPVSDVADPRLVRIAPVPSSQLQPQLQPLQLSVLPALEARVPCLVGPLEVDLCGVRGGDPITSPSPSRPCAVSTGRAPPSPARTRRRRVCSDLVRQPNHELDRSSVPPDLHRAVVRAPVGVQAVLDLTRVRARVHLRPMSPATRLHHVGPGPVHEAQGPVVLDALEVPGVERELLGPALEAGHRDADVADGVVGVRALNHEEEAVVEHGGGLDFNLHPPDSPPHALDVRHGR